MSDYITGPVQDYPFVSYTPNGYQRAMSTFPRSVWQEHGFPLLDPPLSPSQMQFVESLGGDTMRGSMFMNADPVVPRQSDFTSEMVVGRTAWARAISDGTAPPIHGPEYAGPYPRTNSVPFPGMFMRGTMGTSSLVTQGPATDEERLAQESLHAAARTFAALFDAILAGQENIGRLSVLVAYVSASGAGMPAEEIPAWLVSQGYSDADALDAAEFFARVEGVASLEQILTIASAARQDPSLLTDEQWAVILGILEITADQFGAASLESVTVGPAQPQPQGEDKAKTWLLLLGALITAYAMSR
jgi:hypothetical protein